MKLATLCYIRKNGRTLMMHRVKKQNDMHEGKWNGLGGKLIPGESPEECAIREIFEESGLRARNPQLKGVLTFPAFDDLEDWYCFLFEVRDFEGELINSAEGVLEWVPNDKVLDLHLWEGDQIFIPLLDQDRFFSAKFIYEKGRLQNHEIVFHPMA